MQTEIYPITFESVLKDYIWGGRSLEKYGKELPAEGKVAESWEASCHPHGMSVVSNGFLKGRTLPDVIEEYGENVVGTRFVDKKYPLLVKYIDANDRLSVQVHPNDEYARINESGELGKNEMWYIVDAEPGAYIYYGLKENITKEQFAQAIRDNSVEDCLNKLEVKAGDVVNISAGTVHAICSGIIILEVQQNSDATYRVYDYNRKDASGNTRPIHIKKALDVIDFGSKQNKKQKGVKIFIGDQSFKTILVANEFLAAELWEVNGLVTQVTNGQSFSIYTMIDGHLEVSYDFGTVSMDKGQSVLIPATLGRYTFEGEFNAVKSYVPDLEQDIYLPLTERGYTREQIYESVQ